MKTHPNILSELHGLLFTCGLTKTVLQASADSCFGRPPLMNNLDYHPALQGFWQDKSRVRDRDVDSASFKRVLHSWLEIMGTIIRLKKRTTHVLNCAFRIFGFIYIWAEPDSNTATKRVCSGLGPGRPLSAGLWHRSSFNFLVRAPSLFVNIFAGNWNM